MANEGGAARRGRPRDNAVDQRVLNVAWDLLLAGGYAGLNVACAVLDGALIAQARAG